MPFTSFALFIGISMSITAFPVLARILSDLRMTKTDLGVVALTNGFDAVVSILLLPAFFAYAGMRTEIGLLSGAGAWLACALIVVVAALGKCGGTLVAARLGGLAWRRAAALGVLMNTRGQIVPPASSVQRPPDRATNLPSNVVLCAADRTPNLTSSGGMSPGATRRNVNEISAPSQPDRGGVRSHGSSRRRAVG